MTRKSSNKRSGGVTAAPTLREPSLAAIPFLKFAGTGPIELLSDAQRQQVRRLAIVRDFPARTNGSAEGRPSIIRGTCPPSRSLVAGGLPLYGTCTISTPAMILNSSPERWEPVPLPAVAKLSVPGRALASAINSLTDRYFFGRRRRSVSMIASTSISSSISGIARHATPIRVLVGSGALKYLNRSSMTAKYAFMSVV